MFAAHIVALKLAPVGGLLSAVIDHEGATHHWVTLTS